MKDGSDAALTNKTTAFLIRYADDLLYGALALAVAALVIVYYELLSKKLGIPRIVLGVFFILLCFMCLWFDLSLAALLSNSLVRMGMNAVMVLAMVPGIQCGISLNLGLPIGLVAGLIGGLVTIEWGIPGVWGFIVAILVGVVIAAVCGWLYSKLLNRLKGEEMSVTTYVGFSIVSLMCIAWLVLPFKSLKLRWPMGTGLRNTIGLDSTNFKHVLDDFLSFKIGDFVVPTGLLLFMLLMCFLVWLFTRTKTGVAMQAVGNNPRFAEATGIDVDKMRVIGTVLSTVLGAIGILVYSQSYGFMQLYTAPRQMGFIAASAILIGGASTSRCKISHVLIGTFLFQGVLTLGMPVANVLVPGSTISETLRILISNGIILYALTKSGGGSRA
nr:ABC transporter permease [Clostridia bacterium]